MTLMKSPTWLAAVSLMAFGACGNAPSGEGSAVATIKQPFVSVPPPSPYPPGCRTASPGPIAITPINVGTTVIVTEDCPLDSTQAPNFADSIYANEDEVVGPYLQFVDTCYANSGTTLYSHLKGRFPWAFVHEDIYLQDSDDLHVTQTLFEYLFEARRDVFDLWQADPQCAGVSLTQYVQANFPDVYAKVNYENSDIASRRILSDFDGDQNADYATYEQSTRWNIQRSSNGTQISIDLGGPNAKIAPGDYDGDGRTDPAVFDNTTGTWTWQSSANGVESSMTFGVGGDIPVSNDFDGDTKTDFAVWRPSNGTWYVSTSGGQGVISRQWGTSGDVPVTGDYDGDGIADYAIFRPSLNRWWIVLSSSGAITDVDIGNAAGGDRPAPGDYDNDGITDEAVYNPSTGLWTIRYSSTGAAGTVSWGTAGDILAPTDYDGDQQTDFGVWRPSTSQWFHIDSTNGSRTGPPWGASTGVPVASAYLY